MPDPPPAKPSNPKPKKHPKGGWVGPLFSWELFRLARRGQDARGRFILAFLLFLVLTAFSLIWFRNTAPSDLFFGASQQLSIAETSAFGASFSLTFLIAQLGILVLLTPAYAAGGIAEEKDRKTLVFLLVSDLSNREIVFGKFFGRVGFLLGILFAGLPIMAITQLHGGVTIKFLLASYIITATTVIFLAAVSAASAASAETYRGALFRSYGLTAIIVITGCGMGPQAGPFGIIPVLYWAEGPYPGTFWSIAVAYPITELAFSGIAVWLAVRSVRSMRARLIRRSTKPPPWIMDKYRKQDRDAELREEAERLRAEQLETERIRRHAFANLATSDVPMVLMPDDESVPDAAPVSVARAKRIPVAPVSARSKVRPRNEVIPKVLIPKQKEIKVPKKRQNQRVDEFTEEQTANRPRIGSTDPFYWKERFTTGSLKTDDDDAMKSMMYLLGGVLGIIVLFILAIAALTLIASTGTTDNRSVVKWLLLTTGGTGVFVHLLQIGIAAGGAICRERQRLTLESLLTIPVPRSAILWPKWVVSLLRGWWWGGPAAVVMLFALLATDVPVLLAPGVVYFLAMVPFATSYGLWLSIRCRNVNRAIMWFLPVAGFLVIFPVLITSWADQPLWLLWAGLLTGVTLALTLGAWGFWKHSEKLFDRETVLAQ